MRGSSVSLKGSPLPTGLVRDLIAVGHARGPDDRIVETRHIDQVRRLPLSAESGANCAPVPSAELARHSRNSCPTMPTSPPDVIADYGLVDVVAGRFDAGFRLGEDVAKGMITIRTSALP